MLERLFGPKRLERSLDRPLSVDQVKKMLAEWEREKKDIQNKKNKA